MTVVPNAQPVNATVKVFNGYGHQGNLVVYGQIRKGAPRKQKTYSFSIVRNIIAIAKLFFIKPIAFAKVRMQWNEQSLHASADHDGFFKIEWSSVESTPAGWHDIEIFLLNNAGTDITSGHGRIFVPHITQFGFISDIDDTILVSHSARAGKKLNTLFTTEPLKRKTFADVVKFYGLLKFAKTEDEVPNPFFYVSSSEWNLYDYLNDFFTENKLPEGTFLLSDFKQWFELFKLGNTKHKGKGDRVQRILSVFPNQRFILIGDNSQKDPIIYSEIASQYPDRIEAIYLRVIDLTKKPQTLQVISSISNKSIPVHLFEHTNDAIDHARSIGLLSK